MGLRADVFPPYAGTQVRYLCIILPGRYILRANIGHARDQEWKKLLPLIKDSNRRPTGSTFDQDPLTPPVLYAVQKGEHHVTRGSRVIPQRSTSLAQPCLTSEIGRDRVYSRWFERGMYESDEKVLIYVLQCKPSWQRGSEDIVPSTAWSLSRPEPNWRALAWGLLLSRVPHDLGYRRLHRNGRAAPRPAAPGRLLAAARLVARLAGEGRSGKIAMLLPPAS